MKTNKSYTSRVKVSKNGKVIARNPGQNHFNGKESGQAGIAKRRSNPIVMTNKSKSRYLPSK